MSSEERVLLVQCLEHEVFFGRNLGFFSRIIVRSGAITSFAVFLSAEMAAGSPSQALAPAFFLNHFVILLYAAYSGFGSSPQRQMASERSLCSSRERNSRNMPVCRFTVSNIEAASTDENHEVRAWEVVQERASSDGT